MIRKSQLKSIKYYNEKVKTGKQRVKEDLVYLYVGKTSRQRLKEDLFTSKLRKWGGKRYLR